MKRIMVSQDSMYLKDAFRLFMQECRLKNLSMRTETYYQNCYDKFSENMTDVELVESIDLKIYNDYITRLQRMASMNDVSVATYARGIRTFFNWLIKNDYIKNFHMPTMRAVKEIKETYTDAELKLLLKKPSKKHIAESFADYRSWVIINYLMATGNRASTLVSLKVEDLDLDAGYGTLKFTKNKKQQIIPLADVLIPILSEYIKVCHFNNDDWLFPSVYGEKLTVRALGESINKYNKRRGVNRTGTHLFRHTFAKKFIMNQGDLFTLQKMMGHSGLEILKEYVELFSTEVKENNDKFNPLIGLTQQKNHIQLKK
ncbi:MAG: tyrosine-type recombinase/integrase [Bacillota bacterium]|nr:tyrosine-type recombinase/integrase [Bacillota bacterium]